MNQSFFEKYKVFLIGLAGALVLAMTEFITQPVVDWKVVGLAALMAVLSYISNQWRGQGVTILGIIGAVAYAAVTVYNTGNFSWQQFILMAAVSVLAAVAPPPKSLGYEKTLTIENAKKQGDQITKANSRGSIRPLSVILLLLALTLMSSCASAQSFFKALPKKQQGRTYSLSPTGESTMNAIRPIINVASYAAPGNIGLTGAGISWQHLMWSDEQQRWNSQYSISALTWYSTQNTILYGLAFGAMNNLLMAGIATDGKTVYGTFGIGVGLNN